VGIEDGGVVDYDSIRRPGRKSEADVGGARKAGLRQCEVEQIETGSFLLT
jgi:hypothetical protein